MWNTNSISSKNSCFVCQGHLRGVSDAGFIPTRSDNRKYTFHIPGQWCTQNFKLIVLVGHVLHNNRVKKTFFAIVPYTNMAAVTSHENREYDILILAYLFSLTRRKTLSHDNLLGYFSHFGPHYFLYRTKKENYQWIYFQRMTSSLIQGKHICELDAQDQRPTDRYRKVH